MPVVVGAPVVRRLGYWTVMQRSEVGQEQQSVYRQIFRRQFYNGHKQRYFIVKALQR